MHIRVIQRLVFFDLRPTIPAAFAVHPVGHTEEIDTNVSRTTVRFLGVGRLDDDILRHIVSDIEFAARIVLVEGVKFVFYDGISIR